MVDYNIEFGHIYVNENISQEHRQASEIASAKIKELKAQGHTVSSCLLIDEYNPSESLLDIDGYLDELSGMGIPPDFIVFESTLTKYSEKLFKVMNDDVRTYYEKYIAKKGKMPCSFLLGVWHLIRLGVIENGDAFFKANKPTADFYANTLITVLPKRFQSVESAARKIIRCKYPDLIEKMEYIYF